MKYQYISAKVIIADVQRTFNLTGSSWIGNSYESIGEGLLLLSKFTPLELTFKDIEVKRFKARIPCDLELLHSVLFIQEATVKRIIPIEKTFDADMDINNTDSTNHGYTIKGHFIHTNQENCLVRVNYWTIPVDKEGFPLVPDEVNTRTALRYYVLANYLSQGNKHPVFTFETAMQLFEQYKRTAKYILRANDRDERERFLRVWRNLMPINTLWVSETNTNLDTQPI